MQLSMLSPSRLTVNTRASVSERSATRTKSSGIASPSLARLGVMGASRVTASACSIAGDDEAILDRLTHHVHFLEMN